MQHFNLQDRFGYAITDNASENHACLNLLAEELAFDAGKRHVFDSFECAIQALAPRCAHCGCRIIGHGTEASGKTFCCAHCAHEAGVPNVQDRAEHAPQH